MKNRRHLIALAMGLSLGVAANAMATPQDPAGSTATEAQLQAKLEAEYNKALADVEKDRRAAEQSIEKARRQLQLVAEQRRQVADAEQHANAAQAAKMEQMHEELNRARQQLRETSREIARVNRELARARKLNGDNSYIIRGTQRPVIGVILGNGDNVGIKVLGVSPDGPAEQAGIKPGDIIVAMGGRVLAAADEEGDVHAGLAMALQDIKENEPVIVSVERGAETLDLTVVPEIREPLSWQFEARFPTAPLAPNAPTAPPRTVTVERIEVPEIDTTALNEQIERIRVEIDDRGNLMELSGVANLTDSFDFELHELSELGDLALQDANIWFGLPLAQGLKLAKIDPDLGEYFKTERGVLVLKAQPDNDLQLKSGDVILQVGDTKVNSPAEFMRALRNLQAGDSVDIDIKRKRKNRTLNTVMPERRISFLAPHNTSTHTVKIFTQPGQ